MCICCSRRSALGGKLRGLDTYLSYRIGLRTFSASESRTALSVPDAYHLPSVPGSGVKFSTRRSPAKAAYAPGVPRRHADPRQRNSSNTGRALVG
ncbi:hypothetical protein SALBM135S_07322 [Streptomyces alboniger]